MNKTTKTSLLATTFMSVIGMSAIGALLGLLTGQLLTEGYIILLDTSLNYLTKGALNAADDVAVVPGMAGAIGFLCGASTFFIVGVIHCLNARAALLPILARTSRGAVYGSVIGVSVCLINTIAFYVLFPTAVPTFTGWFRPEEAHLWPCFGGLLLGFSIGALTGGTSRWMQLQEAAGQGATSK